MISFGAVKTMAAFGGGVALAGNYGWNRAKNDDSLDISDKLGFATSFAAAGGASALALKTIGLGRLTKVGALTTAGASKAAGLAYKAKNPLLPLLTKVGGGKGFGSFNHSWGPIGALAMFAAGVGAVAYSSRSNPQVSAQAYSEDGETRYQLGNDRPVKGRMESMNALGDMVFGLNNSRHG